MCTLVFNWQPHQHDWLTLASNRDEFYQRPTQPLHQWSDAAIVGGRDGKDGGTWLGVDARANGRFALLTNVRMPVTGVPLQSRGVLVNQYLNGELSPRAFVEQLDCQAFAPFNLLVGDAHELWHLHHGECDQRQVVSAGVHVLSNASLNTPWPKMQAAKTALEAWLDSEQTTPLACVLTDTRIYPDEQLPSTSVPLALERALSAQFIRLEGYGTRSSTSLVASGNTIHMHEITWRREQGSQPPTMDSEVKVLL